MKAWGYVQCIYSYSFLTGNWYPDGNAYTVTMDDKRLYMINLEFDFEGVAMEIIETQYIKGKIV